MNNIPVSYGHQLERALDETPLLSLDFYSYGILLRRRDGDAVSEYPVNPVDVASVLSARVTFDTGFLAPDVLTIRECGDKRLIVAYRKPQLTGVFLDDAEHALRVPLPGLLLIRRTRGGDLPAYQVFAVKRRPKAFDVPLFHAPLPNIFNGGSICWGSVSRPRSDALQPNTLAPDWDVLLGSSFGSHACHNKSRAYPEDIRQQLFALEKRGTRRYPTSDLIPAKQTLAQLLGGLS